MAPFFGASTVIWANTIAVVLVALSVGYRVGGRLADRRPRIEALAGLVLLASALLAVVPFVSHPFLSLSVKAFDTLSAGAFLSSLFGVLVLVAVPVLLLGAVSPWATGCAWCRWTGPARSRGGCMRSRRRARWWARSWPRSC